MNPERKARRNIFLSDPERAAERKELEKRLEMWVDMLKGNKSISEMVELCQKKSGGGVRSAIPEPAESGGRGQAVGEVPPHGHALLQEYGFRQDQEYLHCERFDGASLPIWTTPFFIDAIANELRANYDRLDLRTNYSLLVIPGYLGSNKVVENGQRLRMTTR